MVQAHRGKSPQETVAQVLKVVDYIAGVGAVLGGIVFGCSALYLLYAVLQGNLGAVAGMPQQQADQIVANIGFACQLLMYGGVAFCVCGGLKHRTDPIVGYALFIWGIILCYGLPIILNSTLQSAGVQPNNIQAILTTWVLNGFRIVGISGLITSVPFILVYIWIHMMGLQRDAPAPRPKGQISKDDQTSEKSFVRYFCWQMPYCREHVRGYCKAYQDRKSCWRLKSGCYCDEDMLLRAMKKSPTQKVELLKETYMHTAKTAGQSLTPAQKRQRCRQCFIYGEHQKQKYRILSPLIFPAVAALIWMFYKDIMGLLQKVLTEVDKFAKMASLAPTIGQPVQPVQQGFDASANIAAQTQGSTDIAAYILLFCIGLVVASYLLRGLEYLIFELQV